MITPKDIEARTMSPAKRASAKNDYFAFYVGRPLSYILTVPFLYTKMTPNQVTILSIVPIIIGFVLAYVGQSTTAFAWSWSCFFLWNLLDGVDGNMARYRKQFSKMGSVYDAMAGYIAMVLCPFAWGIIASHIDNGCLSGVVDIPSDLYIVLGALSGIFVIFPRFIMHKAMTTVGVEEGTPSVKVKENYSPIKVIGLNLVSVSGFMQVFMLLCVFFKTYDIFTIAYFFINGAVMMASLISIFKGK